MFDQARSNDYTIAPRTVSATCGVRIKGYEGKDKKMAASSSDLLTAQSRVTSAASTVTGAKGDREISPEPPVSSLAGK